MRSTSFLLTFLCWALRAASLSAHSHPSPWSADRFEGLVAFGDSFTDENRLTYFITHEGAAPPPRTFLPEGFHTNGGGRTWARYIVQYTGTEVNSQFVPRITLYNYAVVGAVCSNNITPKFMPLINADFPSVLEYEVPAFLADMKATRNRTNTPYFTPPLNAGNAVYSMWIGPNDLGAFAFLTDSQVPGKTLTDYTGCVFQALDGLYAAGGRYFVLMNLAPLNFDAPLCERFGDAGGCELLLA